MRHKPKARETLQAAEVAGIGSVTVHTMDEKTRAFCGHFGFVPSPTDKWNLFLPIKDLKRIGGLP